MNATRKIKNKIFAIVADKPARLKKPKKPARIATIKKTNA
jgi:hypothetical protein